MDRKKLNKKLDEHKKWLNDGSGECANLRGTDLRGANLRGADLRGADLRHANLRGADLIHANLRGADLRDAELRGANLRDAELRHADLRHANLRDAVLRHTDLRGADLDYSVFSLFCGSFDMKIDDRLASQLIAHLVRTDYSNCSGEIKQFIDNIPTGVKNEFCEYRAEVVEVE